MAQDKIYFVWRKSIGHKTSPAKLYGELTNSAGKSALNDVIQHHQLSPDIERLDLDTLAKMFPLAA
jgi:hypothetical protein